MLRRSPLAGFDANRTHALPLSSDGLQAINYAGIVSATRLTPKPKIAAAPQRSERRMPSEGRQERGWRKLDGRIVSGPVLGVVSAASGRRQMGLGTKHQPRKRVPFPPVSSPHFCEFLGARRNEQIQPTRPPPQIPRGRIGPIMSARGGMWRMRLPRI